MTLPEDYADVVVRLARALERAGIEYAVGGSVASSAYGEPRATRDLDVAIRLTPALAPALIEALGPDFAVDADMLRDAIRTGQPVNIFYLPIFTKIDLFIRGRDAYDEAEFSTRDRAGRGRIDPGIERGRQFALEAALVSKGRRGIGSAVAGRARADSHQWRQDGRCLSPRMGPASRRGRSS